VPNDVEIRVKGNADFAAVKAQIDGLKAKARDLAREKIKIDADVDQAREKINRLRKELEDETSTRPKVEIDADITKATAEIERLKDRAREIGREKATIGLDTSEATAKLNELKEKAREVGQEQAKIKVEADTAEAQAKMAAVKQQADALDHQRATIKAYADSAAAEAKLAATEAETSSLDGRTAHVNVDADIGSALAKIALVGAALAGLGAAAGGIGAAVGLGAVAGAGIGAAFAGLSGIGGAVKALGQHTAGAGAAAGKAAGQQLQMASAVDRVRSAQASLANTREQVADSERHAAQAAVRAADDERRAAERVTGAQKDLTAARADAARQLRDLARQQEDMALAQRGAALDVEDAQQRLDETLADPRATDLQRRQAQLAFDEAVRHNVTLKQDAADLAAKKADADRRGVAGSAQVVEATRGVVDAQREAARAHLATAEAQDASASAQRDGALRIVQAQQQVVEAQRAVQAASAAAGSAGAAGVDKLGQAMKGLTPTGQAFARFLRGFIDGPLQQLRNAGQEGLLPGLQKGLEALGPIITANLPTFKAFATVVGTALGGIVQVVGQLAVPLMKMATVVLQALAPMQGVLLAFADAFGVVIDRVSKDGTMQAAIGAFVDLLAALLMALPPLIPPMVQLAAAVLPLLTKGVELLTGWLTQLLEWMGGHVGTIVTMAGALLVLVGAVKLVSIGVAAMNVVMALSPIGVVAIALAALAAGFFIAYQKSDAFRVAAQEVFGWLRDHAWPAVKSLAEGLREGLSGAFEVVSSTIAAHREELTTLWHALVAITEFVLDKVVPVFAEVLRVAFIAIGIQVSIFLTIWSGLVIAFQAVASAARWVWDAFGRIGRAAAVTALAVRVGFDRVVGFARALPGRIRAAVVGLMSGITDRTAAAVTWVTARLGGIVTYARSLPGRVAGAAVGFMSGIKEEVGRAVRWITDKIQTVIDFIRAIPGHVASAMASVARATAQYAPGGGLLGLFGHAVGGIIGGAAGGGPRGGLSWVGERGPELLRIPSGSTVYPAGTSGVMAAQAAAARGGVTLVVQPGGGALDRLFVDWLRERVRVGGGGNVQSYLGS
jgi:hypothetical protein